MIVWHWKVGWTGYTEVSVLSPSNDDRYHNWVSKRGPEKVLAEADLRAASATVHENGTGP